MDKIYIDTCLDVASGSGRFSIPISEHGIDVVAVDLDIVPLRKLAGNLSDVMIIRGDANRLLFNDTFFDWYVFSSSQSASAKSFLVSRVTSSSELISSNCGDRCCSSTCHKTFVDVNSVTKTSIMQSIQGELNTYFDCIISLETIDYLEVTDILKEYKRVLRDHGYLIINISNRSSYKGYVQQFLSPHSTFYRNSLSYMKLCLSDEGFKIWVNCQGYNWIPFKRGSNSSLMPIYTHIRSYRGCPAYWPSSKDQSMGNYSGSKAVNQNENCCQHKLSRPCTF